MIEDLSKESVVAITRLLVDLNTCLRDRTNWMESSRKDYARQAKEHGDRIRDLRDKIRALEKCLEKSKEGS